MSSFSANMGLMLGWDNRILSNRSCWFHGVYLQLQGSIKYVMFVLAAGYLSKRYCVIKPTVLINQRCFSYFVKYFLDLTKKNVCFFFFLFISAWFCWDHMQTSLTQKDHREVGGFCQVSVWYGLVYLTFRWLSPCADRVHQITFQKQRVELWMGSHSCLSLVI